MFEYWVNMQLSVLSNLSSEELEKRIVIALYDVDTWLSQYDDCDDKLRVIDYHEISVERKY